MRGEFKSVPIDKQLLKGTREDSETVNVRVPVGFDPSELRSTLYAAVVKSDAVSKAEEKFNRQMVAGIHFNVDEAIITAEFMKKYQQQKGKA
jgi:hypothetical protein